MRTDIQRVKQITKEMKINDLLYNEMKHEYDINVSALCRVDPIKLSKAAEMLYFHRRFLSVLEGQDLPLRSAIGLYSLNHRLLRIEAKRDEYIGDSDTDTDIYSFLLEYGYRIYDRIAPPGTTADEMYEKIVAREVRDK